MNAFFQPGRLRVKICGVTNPEDAAMTADAGADAIGINLFAGSRRFVELDVVREWVAALPLTRVAVVVNPTAEEVARIVAAECFDAIQFHGDESTDFCNALPAPWIRAVRVSDASSLVHALAYETPFVLLDAHAASAYGGTGLTVDPALAAGFVATHPEKSVILAGGLRPDNVAAAARAVRPHGVDVASGVEVDGDARRKDPAKVRAFIEAARAG